MKISQSQTNLEELITDVTLDSSLALCVKKTENGDYLFNTMPRWIAYIFCFFTSWAMNPSKVWRALDETYGEESCDGMLRIVHLFARYFPRPS